MFDLYPTEIQLDAEVDHCGMKDAIHHEHSFSIGASFPRSSCIECLPFVAHIYVMQFVALKSYSRVIVLFLKTMPDDVAYHCRC